MGRVLKWIVLLLLVLVLLVAGAIAAAVILIDPNDYRDDIARVVEEQTGRKLDIEGDIRLTFWPWLGLELGRTTLSDAPEFSDEPFAEINKATLAVEVLPLLRRQVVLDTIVLDGARIRLIVDEQGRGNWEELMERLAEDEAAEPQPRPDEEPGEAPVTLADIGGLQLTNAAVSYEDRQAGGRYAVDPLNLRIDRIRINEPVPVKSDWVVTLPDSMRLAGTLNTELTVDEALEQIAARNLDLRVNIRGGEIPGEQELRVNAPRLAADLAAGRYSAPDVGVHLAGVDIRLQAEAVQKGEDLQASAKLDIAPFDARELMQRLGIEQPERADPDTLGRVSGSAQIRWAGEQLAVDNLRLQLDETTLTGSAKVRSFEGPAADFSLVVDAIDLDRYLPPESEEEVAEAPPEEALEELIPVELLRGLDLNGDFSVGRLKISGAQLADLKGKLTAQKGQLRLAPLTANLYEGSFEGDVLVDVRGEVPRLTIKQRLAGVQAGPLLTDLIGDDWVTGNANVSLELVMAGNSVDTWMNSLGGGGEFKFANATVQGVNLMQELRVAEARLRQQAAPAEERETDFTALTGSFTARNGIIRNEDLNGQSPALRLVGKGGLNLVEMTVDYLLTVNLVDTATGQAGRELDELRRVPIPVRITGPLDDFRVRPDLKAALMDLQGERLRAAETEARERVAEEERRARERVAQEEEELRQRLEQEQKRATESLERRAEDAVRGLLRR
jgi:AsmA protein